ncbi:unknown [Methanoculleus sp. CAG:1088]|nr:unknown [Methanoculleus sp. CAG:1088]
MCSGTSISDSVSDEHLSRPSSTMKRLRNLSFLSDIIMSRGTSAGRIWSMYFIRLDMNMLNLLRSSPSMHSLDRPE